MSEAEKIGVQPQVPASIPPVLAASPAGLNVEKMTECFAYLDDLRESGVNMFGAAPYVKRACKLKDPQAKEAVVLWMRTFDPDKSPADRAAVALSNPKA